MGQSVEARTVSGRRRNIDRILARRRPTGQVLPPDFIHGEVPIAKLYEYFEASWIERALFVVSDGATVTVGYFEDYFLRIEQWDGEDAKRWRQEVAKKRDRRVALLVGDTVEDDEEWSTAFRMQREKLWALERSALGVGRDGLLACRNRQERLQRGRTDLLSLICLVGRGEG